MIIPFGFWGESEAGPIVLSTGLRGARYVDYFNDNPLWFNTATPHGDVHLNRTIIDFSSNADYYSWEWMGYFLAPTTGVYTFYTHSDDASYLWIGDAALNPTVGNALVNNGGLHGMVEVSATVNLTAGRYYAMRVQFGEAAGGDAMVVSFAGPGISKTENGSGYYFGGQEVWRNNWIGGVGSFDQGTPPGGGGSGIVTDQLICNLDARDSATVGIFGGQRRWVDKTATSDCYITNGMLEQYNSSEGFFALLNASSYYADLNLGGFVNSSTPTLTIEMWTRVSDFTGMLFGFNSYDVYYSGGGIGFNTAAGDVHGFDDYRMNGLPFFGRWIHLVFVMQQTSSYTNNKIYADGTLIYIGQVASSENSGNRSFNNGQMRINGWLIDFGYPMRQDLSVFRVYKKELSLTEIHQNFDLDRAHFGRPLRKSFIQNGCTHYFDFEGENDWFVGNGSFVKDYSGFIVRGSLSGGVAWNSGAGGYMAFAPNRDIALNKTAATLGIFYGSFSIVSVIRSSDTNALNIIFGSNDALAYQENVNVGFQSVGYRHSHNSGSDPNTNTNYYMNNNTWYHVVSTYDYATYTVKIYINGNLVISNGWADRVVANQWYYIARAAGNLYTFDLGLFMTYNRVLSQSEVTETFNYQKTRFGL